jgi:hypothetical protein
VSQNSMTLSSSGVGQVGISKWDDGTYHVIAVAYLAAPGNKDDIRYFDFGSGRDEQRRAWALGRSLAAVCDGYNTTALLAACDAA